MKTSPHLFYRFAISIVALVATNAFAEVAGSEADRLVKIKTHQVDDAYVLPGVDFMRYKKVLIAPSEVAFQKDWLRSMNQRSVSLSERISDKDAKKLIDEARSGFDEIWAKAFKAAGYEVVSTPGDDVLKLTPVVFDLYINAPDIIGPTRTRRYTVEAGEASLSLDARDSTSGALLGHLIDKRTAGNHTGRLQWTTSISNRADFDQLFGQWAKLSADGLGELARASPLPEKLQPNQRLSKKQ